MYAHFKKLAQTQQYLGAPVVMAVGKDYLNDDSAPVATAEATRNSLSDVLNIYFEFDELLWSECKHTS